MNFSHMKLKVFFLALNEKSDREEVQKKNVLKLFLCVCSEIPNLFVY